MKDSIWDRIVVKPGVHSGRPCVRGTRVPVHEVLDLVASEVPFSQIIKSYYPEIDEDDIRACVEYAASGQTTEK